MLLQRAGELLLYFGLVFLLLLLLLMLTVYLLLQHNRGAPVHPHNSRLKEGPSTMRYPLLMYAIRGPQWGYMERGPPSSGPLAMQLLQI